MTRVPWDVTESRRYQLKFLQLKSPVMKNKELLSLKISCKVPQITGGNYQLDLDQSDFTDYIGLTLFIKTERLEVLYNKHKL